MGIFTLKVAGDTSILNKKLTSVLKDNISNGEDVLFCLKDLMDAQALIALNSRILIIKMYYFDQYNAVSFLYRNITCIEIIKGLMSSSLVIYTPMDDTKKRDTFFALLPFPSVADRHNSFCFRNMHLRTFLPYIEKIRALVQERPKHSERDNQKSDDSEATRSNIAEQIEKLLNLRQSGALTEGEYSQAKKKILEV